MKFGRFYYGRKLIIYFIAFQISKSHIVIVREECKANEKANSNDLKMWGAILTDVFKVISLGARDNVKPTHQLDRVIWDKKKVNSMVYHEAFKI